MLNIAEIEKMTNSFNLQFCEEYGYPSEIKKHFGGIFSCFIFPGVLSIRLIGSASKGELSFIQKNNTLEIFSDYEFIIITDGKVSRQEKLRLIQKCRMIEKSISSGSRLFHIDFSFIPYSRLKRLSHTLWTYEAKVAGITVYGSDLTDSFPDISVDTLNYEELNEVLVWRLWSLLMYMPKELMHGTILRDSERVYKYVISKNSLDLTTWLLPLEGVLIPSFRGRVRYIHDNYQKLKCSKIMGEGFPEFLTSCLKGKMRLEFDFPLLNFYTASLDYFVKASRFLLECNGIKNTGKDSFRIIEQQQSRLFRTLTFRQIVYELLVVLRSHDRAKRPGSMKLFFTQKQGIILHLLYRMHLSLLAFKNGNQQATESHLAIAIDILRKIYLNHNKIQNVVSLEFPQKWILLRECVVELMMFYFSWIRQQRHHLESVLDNTYE